MQTLSRFQIKSYSVAVIAVVLALIFTQLLWPLHKLTVYPIFFAAVMVASWYGGIKPGLLATTLSAFVCAYFFLPPLYSFAVSGSSIVGLVQFLLVSLLICMLNAMLRSSQQQAETNARKAQLNYDRLRESEERYHLFMERVKEYAIFMLDTNGLITDWNTGAERILGYQEAEIVGQPFERIFTPEDIRQGRPQQALSIALANGTAKNNHWHVRKDGTRFWGSGVIVPLQNGNMRGFAKILQDLTQHKQTEEERSQLLLREQTARESAEAANRSKDDFLAMVSHELRTPMTAIVGWVGMLRTGMLDQARVLDALETIERNADLQLQLIEDLLDISRIVRGEISLSCDTVNLVEVITAAIEVVQPTAAAKGIQLESILDTSIEPVWGDSDRLQQVVWNLLSNAIKFTPSGGRVEVRLSVVNVGENYAQIQVSDTGMGISSDFLPHIFERFRQGDSTSTRSNKGLGLGLAIARHVVELHGGTIQAESPGIGQGATFTVKLPQTGC